MKPGPIYCKTLRKCAVFGVMTEALPQKVVFFLHEAIETGKGEENWDVVVFNVVVCFNTVDQKTKRKNGNLF